MLRTSFSPFLLSITLPNLWRHQIGGSAECVIVSIVPAACFSTLRAGRTRTDRKRVGRRGGPLLHPRIHGIIQAFLELMAENTSKAMSVSDEAQFEPVRRIQFAFTDEQEQFRAAI